MPTISDQLSQRTIGKSLSDAEIRRYSRHLLLPQVGKEGQLRLRESKVLIIGAGGLGAPTCLYLAAAGIGTIGIIDFDRVDESNLQRQVLYSASDVGSLKSELAASRMTAINPALKIRVFSEPLNVTNISKIIPEFDIIIDGTDNFATRYLVNDACVLLKRPYIYGSIFRFEGHASVFATPGGPCYRCLFPSPPAPDAVPSCAEGGVLGVLPGIIGTIQATETLKLILGIGESLSGRLLTLDALTMNFDYFNIAKNPNCPICGDHPTITTITESAASCAIPTKEKSNLIHAKELDQLRKSKSPHTLIDVRTKQEIEICKISGAITIPLDELPKNLGTLDRANPIVVYCKSGTRSARAVDILISHGFNAKNLDGGILRWISEVEPNLTSY